MSASAPEKLPLTTLFQSTDNPFLLLLEKKGSLEGRSITECRKEIADLKSEIKWIDTKTKTIQTTSSIFGVLGIILFYGGLLASGVYKSIYNIDFTGRQTASILTPLFLSVFAGLGLLLFSNVYDISTKEQDDQIDLLYSSVLESNQYSAQEKALVIQDFNGALPEVIDCRRFKCIDPSIMKEVLSGVTEFPDTIIAVLSDENAVQGILQMIGKATTVYVKLLQQDAEEWCNQDFTQLAQFSTLDNRIVLECDEYLSNLGAPAQLIACLRQIKGRTPRNLEVKCVNMDHALNFAMYLGELREHYKLIPASSNEYSRCKLEAREPQTATV